MANRTNQSKKMCVYIHWPFCRARCVYCGFFSTVGKEKLVPKYVTSLKNEIQAYKQLTGNYRVETLYLGGGTPSLVAPEYISEVVDCCKNNFDISPDIEITIEANPDSLSKDKLDAYLSYGVNRLSIGLQAWQDQSLKQLGRIHSQTEFVDKYKLARKVGFQSINVDLIFGFPGQTLNDWQESLNQVLQLEPDHMSIYSLELDNQSYWGKLHSQGKIKPVDEKLDREMYHWGVNRLEQAGLQQYEVSNFAKLGKICRHNKLFWEGYEYVGIGAGAYSFFNRTRYHDPESIEEYCRLRLRNQDSRNDIETTTADKENKEYWVLKLRLKEGLRRQEFVNKFGQDFESIWGIKLDRLKVERLIQVDKEGLRLTSKGLDVIDAVIRELAN